ncbi:MAG: hypothetical protein WCG78_00075 [Candidatus Omnitrophota bacterium]
MKRVIRVAVIALCFFGIIYFGQAQKANKICELKLHAQLQAGQLSREAYEKLSRENSLLKTLLNPGIVLKTD